MNDLIAALTVARKDFRQELRSRATTVATLFFSAITLVMMAFGLGRDPDLMRSAAPGVLWVALAFAGVIAAAQSFQADLEEGAFEQLLLLPASRAAIYLGKLTASWLYLFVLGVLMLPIALGLYGASAPTGTWWLLGLVLLLGTLGLAMIATFYAGLTANLQAREALLPVLMFPVIVPIMLGAVRATEAALMGGADVPLALSWVQLLAGFDLVYLVVCASIFHFVVDD